MTGRDGDTNLLEHLQAASLRAACQVCAGEGFRYVEQTGRQRREPVTEIPCERCNGTGLVRAA